MLFEFSIYDYQSGRAEVMKLVPVNKHHTKPNPSQVIYFYMLAHSQHSVKQTTSRIRAQLILEIIEKKLTFGPSSLCKGCFKLHLQEKHKKPLLLQ